MQISKASIFKKVNSSDYGVMSWTWLVSFIWERGSKGYAWLSCGNRQTALQSFSHHYLALGTKLGSSGLCSSQCRS